MPILKIGRHVIVDADLMQARYDAVMNKAEELLGSTQLATRTKGSKVILSA